MVYLLPFPTASLLLAVAHHALAGSSYFGAREDMLYVFKSSASSTSNVSLPIP